MRITIDCTPLLLRSAGVKTYLYHWVCGLLKTGRHELRLFPFLDRPGRLTHASSTAGRLRTLFNLALVNLANIRGNRLLELMERRGVFHASQHLVNPPVRRVRLTATIYDMTCWLLPETHRADNVLATKLYAERVLRRADACIAISGSARQDAMEILGLPGDRVTMIYPGVADAFFDPPRETAAAHRRYRLTKPYILFAGTIEPRKNVDRLVEAYRNLPLSLRKHCELVFAGFFGWCSDSTRQLFREPDSGIRHLGYVPEEDLPALTAGATLAAFPSLYEGFGFPVAQAMAAGVPVLTSNGSSLSEIAADACLLVNPESSEEIGAGLARLLESESLRRELSERGKRRARQFRWDLCAERSMEFFEAVCG